MNATDTNPAAFDYGLFKLPAKYCAALIKHSPVYSGNTVFGVAAVYECHIDGEDAPLVIVIDGTAYETDAYHTADLRY